jgi:protein TonB
MNVAVNTGVSLRAPGGQKKFKPKSKFGIVGVAVMAFAHLLIGYALATGLAQQAFQLIKKPLDATIIDEVKLPPPPPPPPKIEKVKETPKVEIPPPTAFVPPPEVVTAPQTNAPTITAVQNTPVVQQPPPPAPTVVAPTKTDIALVCPKQVKPVVPDKAIDDGISGTVKAEVRIKAGKVISVNILSGPKVFHGAVKTAILHYECQSGSENEVVATQEFTFKVE